MTNKDEAGDLLLAAGNSLSAVIKKIGNDKLIVSNKQFFL